MCVSVDGIDWGEVVTVNCSPSLPAPTRTWTCHTRTTWMRWDGGERAGGEGKDEVPEAYRRKLSERTRAARLRAAREGRQPAAIPPYGYRIVRKSDCTRALYPITMLGQYVVVEEEARYVRFMFEEYLRTGSVTQVAEALGVNGVKTPHGGSVWHGPAIHKMLRNSVYAGRAEYGREQDAKGRRVAGTGIAISCPAIVDALLFEAVQSCMDSPAMRGTMEQTAHKVNLLRGMVICGDCGGEMFSGFYPPSKEKGRAGGGYYACRTCKPTWNSETPRPQWSTYHPAMLHAMVREALEKLLPEDVRPLTIEFLFSPHWDYPAWKRRNLLLAGRLAVKVYNQPCRVEVRLGGPSASDAVSAYMGAFMGKRARLEINEHFWARERAMAALRGA